MLAARADAHMRATSAQRYAYAAPGEVETNARENLHASLKSQAHLASPFCPLHRAGAVSRQWLMLHNQPFGLCNLGGGACPQRLIHPRMADLIHRRRLVKKRAREVFSVPALAFLFDKVR